MCLPFFLCWISGTVQRIKDNECIRTQQDFRAHTTKSCFTLPTLLAWTDVCLSLFFKQLLCVMFQIQWEFGMPCDLPKHTRSYIRDGCSCPTSLTLCTACFPSARAVCWLTWLDSAVASLLFSAVIPVLFIADKLKLSCRVTALQDPHLDNNRLRPPCPYLSILHIHI